MPHHWPHSQSAHTKGLSQIRTYHRHGCQLCENEFILKCCKRRIERAAYILLTTHFQSARRAADPINSAPLSCSASTDFGFSPCPSNYILLALVLESNAVSLDNAVPDRGAVCVAFDIALNFWPQLRPRIASFTKQRSLSCRVVFATGALF